MPKTKTTVSITFLGTGNHRTTHETVLVSAHNQINELAKAPNSRVVAWLIDGPGCDGTPEHPTPGTYFYQEGKKTHDPQLANEQMRKFRNAMKQLSGEGVESSIMEATTYIEEVIAQNGDVLPKELNLQGFSRGADNCVRLANIIYLLHPSIKINLFLVDPVPGPDRRDDPESYHVPPSVQHAQITLMLNEHKPFFDPQHPDRYVFMNPKTRVAFNYLPGRHGAALATKEGMAVCPPESQILTQDSLLKFNIEHNVLPKDAKSHYWHGSRSGGGFISHKLDIPQKQLTKKERFVNLCQAMQSYKMLAQRPLVLGYHKRRIYYDRKRYVMDSKLFISQEHRELFKAIFPATFNWFFEKNVMPAKRQKPYVKEDVFRECKRLKSAPYTEFYQDLLTMFSMPDVNRLEDILDEPQGVARIDKMTHNEPLVTDELSYLQFCLKSIITDYHYRVPLTRFSSGSLRGEQKGNFTKNWQSNAFAKDIKNALYQSMRLPPQEAKNVLKKVMAKIKSQSSPSGFFLHEISKIIPDSRKYIGSVLDTLERYQALLPSPQDDWVAKTVYLVQKQMNNPYKDHYQKRQSVHAYLVGLNTALHRINKETIEGEPIIYQQLFDSLNQLSRSSYAETLLQDNLIADLESYIQWRSFLSYFPFSQVFGIYNPDSVSLANDLLSDLYELKNSPEEFDLTQTESILKGASLKYTQLHKREDSDNTFTFWKKHLIYKTDPLNRIIESHLKKVTKLSNLIFSVPKGPGRDLDSDHGNRHSFSD